MREFFASFARGSLSRIYLTANHTSNVSGIYHPDYLHLNRENYLSRSTLLPVNHRGSRLSLIKVRWILEVEILALCLIYWRHSWKYLLEYIYTHLKDVFSLMFPLDILNAHFLLKYKPDHGVWAQVKVINRF